MQSRADPMLNDSLYKVAKTYEAGYAHATADIVAWLRGLQNYEDAPMMSAARSLIASAIECGEFRKVTA